MLTAAAPKLFAKRLTCMEFHPHNDGILLAGSKHGHLAVWRYRADGGGGSSGATPLNAPAPDSSNIEVTKPHEWYTTSITFPDPSKGGSRHDVVTAGVECKISKTDIYAGVVDTVLNANAPGLYHSNRAAFVFLQSMAYDTCNDIYFVGTHSGKVMMCCPEGQSSCTHSVSHTWQHISQAKK